MTDTDTIVLSQEALSVSEAQKAVASSKAGAISLFVGTTRDEFQGKQVVNLEYEAYEPMAKSEMRALCITARRKWPEIICIAVMHRIGTVPVGDTSVIIAVSSPHRIHAIEACHSIIDDLKARVPIWKKEVYKDGSMWKANSESKRC